MSAEDPVDVLQRWESFGGTWRVVGWTDSGVTISMCRCDGGEQVQELTSDDPHLLDWLRERGTA
jgi:hypothetical protein